MKKKRTGSTPLQKLWGGRFTGATDARVEAFTQSLESDKRLASYDIAGSCAHAAMLAKIGILTQAEARRIIRGLRAIGAEIKSGTFDWRVEYEDVHMNIEAALTERVGEVAKKLHTGRSRNDQVALDERLWLRDILTRLSGQIGTLQRALVELADANKEVIIPGFTHLQYAMPVLAAHHLLAYVEMLERDRERFEEQRKRVNVMPLGAGALAGSGFALDRAFVAGELGFTGVTRNSMDSVADRDYFVEFVSAAALVGMHLSRLCEDFILWMSQPFGFIDISDAFCTGSSLMPNKKNPDVLELIRGKCGRLYGNVVALLTVMKGLPMTYNRDMQEDKRPVFDSADTLEGSLAVLAALVPTVRFQAARLAQALQNDFLMATDWVEYLVRKGMPFRAAHELVGQAVALAVERRCGLTELPVAALEGLSRVFDADILKVRSAASSVAAKRSAGSTRPQFVRAELQRWKKQLAARMRATNPV